MTFTELGLSPKVLSAVTSAGYETPTPIQRQAIPPAIAGRDVLGIAQTGTGKTASFVLPMLTRLERGRARARMPRSLILEPTRELAAQVAEHFETLGKDQKLTIALLIGGVSYEEQDRKLGRGADVVIATPGRLLDHMSRGKILLSGIEILVVDEADRMLDMGFIPDIERICKQLPFTRQTLFFSATMPPEIQRLADKFLHNPERIEIAPQSTAATTIVQRLKKSSDDPAAKREALRDLMRAVNVKNAIIFCNRKKDVGIVYRSLQRHGFNVGALHGDMDQHQRTATLDAFRNGTIAFLAASDVAARGLDIPDVSHIFNYDVPIHPEDYIHRIGRTGRAGREGFAAMLVTPKDIKALKAIERMLKTDIEWMDGTPEWPADGDGESGARRSGGRGRRPARSGKGGNGGASRQNHQTGRPQESRPSSNGNGNGTGNGNGHRAEAMPQPVPRSEQRPERPQAASHPVAAPQPKQAPTQQQPNRQSQPRGGQDRSSRVRGMGDHVPAFMTRPVRVP